ncbi:MAG: hypothetical protein M3169_11330 [Candidatus Eremiobacteraeota bacterium]|nr:hypothetical protein [Candidatus Eremiobacteraeota bacterium]
MRGIGAAGFAFAQALWDVVRPESRADVARLRPMAPAERAALAKAYASRN